MVLAGVEFWYDNYGILAWQAKPRQTILDCFIPPFLILVANIMSETVIGRTFYGTENAVSGIMFTFNLTPSQKQAFWARLFKTNDVIS